MQLTSRLTAICHLNKTFLRNTSCSQISACVLKFTPIEMPWLRTRKQQKKRTTKTKRVLSSLWTDLEILGGINPQFLSEINCRAFVRTRDRVCDFAPRIFMKWLNKYTFLCPNFPYSKTHSFQQRNNSNNGMTFARTRQFENHFRNIWLHRKHQPKVTKGCFLSVRS